MFFHRHSYVAIARDDEDSLQPRRGQKDRREFILMISLLLNGFLLALCSLHGLKGALNKNESDEASQYLSHNRNVELKKVTSFSKISIFLSILHAKNL
jgi:hypothetical protein